MLLPSRHVGKAWALAASMLLLGVPVLIRAGDSYQIKFKTHQDTGKTSQVEQQETIHSQSKLVGLIVKKVLENNEEKQSALYRYRETILEKPKGQNHPTRLRRQYEKAQLEVAGKKSAPSWEGKTILIEKKKDRYQFSVEGGPELTGKDAEPLADEFQAARGPSGDFSDLLPPDKALRVNETHDLDAKALLKHFENGAGIKFDVSKAKGTLKLLRVYKKQGRQFGVVDVHIELPLQELASTPKADPKAAEKLVMRPGAKMTLHAVIDGCIDGSAAIATSKIDMEINGTALVPSPDNPQFELMLAIKTSTQMNVGETD
jgi:hypothetical protein